MVSVDGVQLEQGHSNVRVVTTSSSQLRRHSEGWSRARGRRYRSTIVPW